MGLSVTPFEIIAGPADVWVGAADATPPAIDAAVGAGWTALGYTDGGITVQHAQTIEQLRVDQAVFPVKAIRTELSLTITFTMVALDLERYLVAVNKVTGVDTPTAITKGKRIDLDPGVSVKVMAMLIRGPSPYGTGSSVTDWWLQYALPKVFASGNPQVAFTRDAKAGMEMEFQTVGSSSVPANYNSLLGDLSARNAA